MHYSKEMFIEEIREILLEMGFIEPKIKYILKNKNQMIIGVFNEYNSYVCFISEKEAKVISENSIKLKKKYKNAVDECIESFILMKLTQSYKMIYSCLNIHFNIWNFVDCNLDNMEIFLDGILEYINYCNETGINHKLINNYGYWLVDDLANIFENYKYRDCIVILNDTIGDKKITLLEKQDDSLDKRTYVVSISNNVSNEVFRNFHNDIEAAYIDFNNHRMGLKDVYEKQLVNNFYNTISLYKEERNLVNE